MKKIIVFLCVLFSVVIAAVAVTALYVDFAADNNADVDNNVDVDNNAEGIEAPSVQTQNASVEAQKVLNPLNVEVEAVEKITSEGALEALVSKAKAMVADSTTFEMDIPDRSNLRPQDYFFTLDQVLRIQYARLHSDEYGTQIIGDVARIDITADKGNEKNIQVAEYMTFLALLFKTYPDCVGFMDYKYFEHEYSRIFFDYLIFCPDYAEYGYDTIYDYYEAVRSGKEARLENYYHIGYSGNIIKECSSGRYLYDTLFNNTESK